MSVPVSYYDDPTACSMPQILTDKPVNYSFYRPAPAGIKKRYDLENIDYVNYREGIYSGYRYYVTEKVRTAYPFGFGLSYTDFRYSGMTVEEDGEDFVVSLDVENTGGRSGKEVVQIYVKAPGRDMDKPSRELKGFTKTGTLAPGQSETVRIRIPRSLLASYDEERIMCFTIMLNIPFCRKPRSRSVYFRAKVCDGKGSNILTLLKSCGWQSPVVHAVLAP